MQLSIFGITPFGFSAWPHGWSLLFLLPSFLYAQPIPQTFETLEAKMAKAETIVMGTIERLEAKRFPSRGQKQLNLDVRVGKVLRGDKAAVQITNLRKSTGHDDVRFEEWKKNSTRIVWFIGKRKKPDAPAATDVLRIGDAVAAEETTFPQLGLPIFSAKLTWLDDPNDAMKVVRDYTRRYTRPARVTYLGVPPIVCQRCDPGVAWHNVIVPVDSDLEKLANTLLKNPQNYFRSEKPKPADIYQLQHQAMEALNFFPSRENTELLEQFLDTPALSLPDRAGEEQPLAAIAFQILEQWGANPKLPAIKSKIKSLILRGKSIDDRSLRKITQMTGLKTFYLFNSSATAAGLRQLQDLPKLRQLELGIDLMTDEVIEMLFQTKQIHRVTWAQTRDDVVRPTSPDEIVYLALPQSKKISNASVERLVSLKNLEILDLRNSQISNDAVKKLGKLKKLKWLWISGTRIDSTGREALTQLLPACKIR